MLKEALLSEVARYRHHHPKYPGQEDGLDPIPYLRLPFRREDLAHYQVRPGQLGIGTKIDYQVSEGWFYSQEVKRIVPYNHAAVDYNLPFGFPVASPIDGIAMSSYYSYPLVDRRGNVKTKNGIHLRFGIGYFVQIYSPSQDRIVQLGHLCDVADYIPFSIPVRQGHRWMATGHVLTREQMFDRNNPNLVRVRTGEIVGYVGYSGLTDQEDYFEGYERPYVIDPKTNGTWRLKTGTS